MAEKIVSPGVFTNEKDLTFLPEGISEIGANIIGQYEKGPAFEPTIVESQNDFTLQFGENNDKLYAPYAAKSYLQNAGRATITRILGENGYSASNPLAITTDQNQDVAALLAPTKYFYENGGNTDPDLSSSTISGLGSGSEFVLNVSSSQGTQSYSASLDPTDQNYITKVFGTDPQGKKPVYVYKNFKNNVSSSIADLSTVSAEVSASYSNTPLDLLEMYNNGETPWIQSNNVGGVTENLFKIHAISDGDVSNTEIKVAVTDISHPDDVIGSDYGSFGIEVREYDDTDRKPSIVESFSNLNLNPNSPNYIAKRIGDMHTTVTTGSTAGVVKVDRKGDFENNSDYIYVEMADDIDSLEESRIPFGFAPYKTPLGGDLDQDTPTMIYKEDTLLNGASSSNAYFGVDFTKEDSKQYFAPVPAGATTGSNNAFSLNNVTDSDNNSFDVKNTDQADRKFIMGLQNGFDGFDPAIPKLTGENITATNTQGIDISSKDAFGTKLYEKALDIISNADVYDINMILTPGVLHSYHSDVTSHAISVAEKRADTFYLMDNTRLNDSIQQAIDSISDLDTSYAGTYHPWTKVRDYDNQKNVWVPPSVTMPSVFAFNDSVAAEWFAPAGLNRGGIDDAIDVSTKLAKAERDKLYENRVNPIASFTNQGIVAWGQKTLQVEASALDRINVRRLLIDVKKFIASTSRFLVFEQNTAATRNRFLNIVNPYLESIQQRSGLYDFRVKMDEELNTPEVIDRNQLIGQIFLQPTRTAEFIIVDFSLVPTGATFDE